MNRARDIFLICIWGALIGVAVMPRAVEEPEDETLQLAQLPNLRRLDELVGKMATEDRPVASPEPPPDPAVARPRAVPAGITGASGPLFPLIPGSEWVFRVAGDPRLVKSPTWSMKVVSAPAHGRVTLLMGGGESGVQADVWRVGGSMRFTALPYVEPLEFFGSEVEAADGTYLPDEARIIEDAVWVQTSRRLVSYRDRGDEETFVNVPAIAVQRDRAHVKERETVTVPAGRFLARRISWISRVRLEVGGRAILNELTSEPYRREITWLVPGIGIVAREITYTGSHPAAATPIRFELESYALP